MTDLMKIFQTDSKFLELPDLDKVDYSLSPAADEILQENIRKANTAIDMALAKMGTDTITPRYIETLAKLIDSVTLAAEKLIGANTEIIDLQIKRDLLILKQRELGLKKVEGSFTREEALRLLKEKKEKENDENTRE